MTARVAGARPGRRARLAAADDDGGNAVRAPVLLADTSVHLTGLVLDSPTAVRAGTGVTMEYLLTFLEENGLGVTAAPASV